MGSSESKNRASDSPDEASIEQADFSVVAAELRYPAVSDSFLSASPPEAMKSLSNLPFLTLSRLLLSIIVEYLPTENTSQRPAEHSGQPVKYYDISKGDKSSKYELDMDSKCSSKLDHNFVFIAVFLQ